MRPYLLRKFRNRPCREIREVPKEAFARLREGLLNYARENHLGNVTVPMVPDSSFFKAVEDMMSRMDNSVSDLALCEHEGSLSVTGFFTDMDALYDSAILEVAGVEHIGDPALRQLALDFVASFIHGNGLTAFGDSVWSCLLEEQPDIDSLDLEEDEKETLKMSASLMLKEEEPTRQFRAAIRGICESTDSLRSRLEAFNPKDERDKKTVEVLTRGLAWLDCLGETLEDDNNYYGYASVEVLPTDMFIYVSADHDMTHLGWQIIDGAYGGDAYFHDLPVRFSLGEDGKRKEDIDLSGFSRYTEEISEQLKRYL